MLRKKLKALNIIRKNKPPPCFHKVRIRKSKTELQTHRSIFDRFLEGIKESLTTLQYHEVYNFLHTFMTSTSALCKDPNEYGDRIHLKGQFL